MHVVGNKSYKERYTLEEYQLLKEQLFGWQLKELEVVEGEVSEEVLKKAKKDMERAEEMQMEREIRENN